MKYKWKRNGLGGVSAEVAAQEVESIIEQHGGVTPEMLVAAATKKTSPLRDCFEWNDTVAARGYRLDQARYILRQIEVVIEREDKPALRVRAFHYIEDEEQGRRYVTITQARDDRDMWAQVKIRAMAEMKQWAEIYKDIKEFEAVCDAISKVKV